MYEEPDSRGSPMLQILKWQQKSFKFLELEEINEIQDRKPKLSVDLNVLEKNSSYIVMKDVLKENKWGRET